VVRVPVVPSAYKEEISDEVNSLLNTLKTAISPLANEYPDIEFPPTT
jgi:hypothetical protein